MPRTSVANSLKRQGFPDLIDVRGRNSIADLIPPSKRRAGLYVLQFENGHYYIGQAVEPVRRFAQHRKRVGGIVGYGFRPCPPALLNSAEKSAIQCMEREAVLLSNVVHVAQVHGATDLDDLIDRSRQEAWLKGSSPLREPKPVRIPADAALRTRTSERKKQLEEKPQYDEVLRCLHQYARNIPFPRSTQLVFWSVSCLPSTGAGSFPRYAALSAAMMEMLVLGWRPGRTNETWGFVNVSQSVCLRRYGTVQALRKALPGVTVDTRREYRDAGQDQLRLEARSIDALTALLARRTIARAAADLMLRVMQKRATIYSSYHCPDLADAMLGRTRKRPP